MRSLVIAVLTIAAIGIAFSEHQARAAAAPDAAKSREALGSGLQKDSAGDINGAIDDYTRAIELDPKNTLAYVRRGMAYDTLGELEKEIADYTAVLALKIVESGPEAAVRAMRGDVYLRLGKSKEAVADFDRALVLDPKLFQAYQGRAIVRLVSGEFAKAGIDYQSALKERPQDRASQYGLGVVAYASQDWRTAELHFSTLWATAPDDAHVGMWLLLAQRRNGKAVNAAEFKAVDQTQWPGQVVAHLVGNVGPMDTFLDEAAEHHDPNEQSARCTASFATFSLLQIEDGIAQAAQAYVKANPGTVYLNEMRDFFQRCTTIAVEGHVALNEISRLKAR
jgi:tetratricopeptide (TPR) repeat protein